MKAARRKTESGHTESCSVWRMLNRCCTKPQFVSRRINLNRALGVLLDGLLLTGSEVAPAETNPPAATRTGKVYTVPIRENIMPPLVYVVRRGV